MSTKKRFFTRNKEKVGKKSGKPREKESKVVTEVAKNQAIEEKESRKNQQLPINYRSITEPFHRFQTSFFNGFSWRKGLLMLFLLILFGISLWQGVILGQNLTKLQIVLQKRETLSNDLKLWENISSKYPSYRDAYFQAAVLAYQLGDSQKKELYIGKTLQLDPNFPPAQNLEKLGK